MEVPTLLMIVVLKNEGHIKKVAPLLLELGHFDASVLEGEGAENVAASVIPVFSSFKSIFGEGYTYNKTLLVPVKNTEEVDEFVHLAKGEGIDFNSGDAGYVLALPITYQIGLGEET